MLASLFIIAASLAMLFYWLRYSCVLLQAAHASDSRVQRTVQANGLNLQSARAAGETLERPRLREVQRMLDHDQKILEFLLEQSGALSGMERWMLRTDYSVMSGVCRVGRLLYPPIARAAMRQMTANLTCLASALGQQAEQRGRA